MKTSTLKLPPQVIPQIKADTETPKSIFENPQFLAELKKGPEEALRAIKSLNPEQRREFAEATSQLTGVKVSPRDLASLLAEDFLPAFVASYEDAKANPEDVRANPKAFVQDQVAKIKQTQASKAVVQRSPVVGRVRLEKPESPSRVLAQVLAA